VVQALPAMPWEGPQQVLQLVAMTSSIYRADDDERDRPCVLMSILEQRKNTRDRFQF